MSAFTVIDHSVSKEQFTLVKESKFGFLETTPMPSLNDLPKYYESEDYISHTDSKRNLFEKIYHLVKVYALNKKCQFLNSFKLKEKVLLDVGCGTGDFLSTAKHYGWNGVGVEPNASARILANDKTGNNVFPVEQLDEFKNNSFDVITLWHVLEHLPNLEYHVSKFFDLLKPGGKIIIAVPNYKSFDAEYYKSNWAAYDVPRHLWHFDRVSIKSLFSCYKLELEKVKPMWFDSFYVSLLSEKIKTGKMNFLKGFWIGLRSNWSAVTTNEASSLIYVFKKSKN